MNATEATEKLDRYIRARYPIIALVSHEESRVLASIRALATKRNRDVAEWAITTGLKGVPQIDADSTKDPVALFAALIDNLDSVEKATLFVLKDFHGLLNDPVTVRYIRDIAAALEKTPHNVIFLSPSFTVPNDLEKSIVMLDWPLPEAEELGKILARVERTLPASVKVTLNGNRDSVVKSLLGLTAFEAESVLLSAVAATGELGDSVITHVVKEKAQIIRKSGVLEYYDTSLTMADVGGLGALKAYAKAKMATFSADATAAGLEPAKGCLLVGVPGTGKSLSAKAIAGGRVPLLKLDIGNLMTSELGGSEKNLRQVFRVVEAIGPSVLWVDEIEKALADNDGRSDGGVKMGMLGALLTWMQERTCPVYVVATANNARALKPELISRFDDTIWVDLPNAESRVEILSVHLSKRGKSLDSFTADEIKDVVAATWGFSGREIERIVKTAIETAYFDKRAITAKDLLDAATDSVPTAQIMKAQIDDLRAWAKSGQIRLAGIPLEDKPQAEGKRMVEI
jgi:AAA+ superfamily predicted ATPase